MAPRSSAASKCDANDRMNESMCLRSIGSAFALAVSAIAIIKAGSSTPEPAAAFAQSMTTGPAGPTITFRG